LDENCAFVRSAQRRRASPREKSYNQWRRCLLRIDRAQQTRVPVGGPPLAGPAHHRFDHPPLPPGQPENAQDFAIRHLQAGEIQEMLMNWVELGIRHAREHVLVSEAAPHDPDLTSVLATSRRKPVVVAGDLNTTTQGAASKDNIRPPSCSAGYALGQTGLHKFRHA
jgi:hypothetical protein